ncbi:MAG: Orn/Lys/Arg decarboxylase N-terminal domain-containing protein [Candidatus Dormiibacterota bacterium]
MLAKTEFPVLMVSGRERRREADRTIGRIVDALQVLGHRVEQVETVTDATALVTSDPTFGGVLVDWGLGGVKEVTDAEAIITSVRQRNDRMPIFVFLEQGDLEALPLSVTEATQEYVFLFEDTPDFIAGRIDWAWRRYTETLLPPYFQALLDFTDSYEYSMHTPGHAGGTAFRKSAIGRAFYDFYGENLFRTDLSVSLGPLRALGSLLDHSGKVGESEQNAARIFGADQTFFVLNGTSTANQIVGHSCITAGDVVLVDRNCHKSMNYSLTVTDAVPVYLMPVRNGYGIMGPIPAKKLSSAAVAKAIATSPLRKLANATEPVYAAVTNSTYDGLCYDASRTAALLGESVARVHFDEAWFGYACFNPLYRDRYAMGSRPEASGPTLYATQSTHKLLAAFSQGSMIHIRSGERAPVDHDRFNEAYMMHGSTSPFYPMIACLDVAAAMMDDPGGLNLTDESIREAVHFRKRFIDVGAELTRTEGWFFGLWQPESVRDPKSGKTLRFNKASDELLATEPTCWELVPSESWHGFSGLTEGFCMLDPIKVTVTTPGIDAQGTFADRGIPAQVVTLFLHKLRIEVEKTGDYTFLVLFSIGFTKGKWGTLLDGLLAFKRAYDQDQPLAQALPELVAAYPDRYGKLTLRGLCDEMHAEMQTRRLPDLLDRAFGDLPGARCTPGEAYRRLVRSQTERVPLSQMAGKAAAVMVVPYPPGIPVLMPGEEAGTSDGPVLQYLGALEDFDRRFPSFDHDIHGVERDPSGAFQVECLKQ